MFKVLFVMSKFDSTYIINQVINKLKKENKQIEIKILNTFEVDKSQENFEKSISIGKESDFIFICCHGGFHRFKRHKEFFDILSSDNKKFFLESGIQDDIDELIGRTNITVDSFYKIYRYFLMKDERNLYNLMLLLANEFGYLDYSFEEVFNRKWEGVYKKDLDHNEMIEYFKSLQNKNKPVIGIIFHVYDYFKNDTLHIDKLIEEIIDSGGIPLPLYSGINYNELMNKKGIYALVDMLLNEDKESYVDVIINVCAYSLSILGKPGDGQEIIEESIFKKLNIPVIKAITTFDTLEQWNDSIVGLDGMSLISHIVFPEFDGQIMGIPIACKEAEEDEYGTRYINFPLNDRIKTISNLAMNWSKLKYKANKDKKIGIILHNMPPRNDMIGSAHGLDTPESVYNLVNAYVENGIKIDKPFKDSKEIIDKIIDGVSNDNKWLNKEEVHKKALDEIPSDLYKSWFDKLDKTVKNKMIKDWKEPPGEFMVYDDKIVVPGILNGNIFIGLQPPRALGDLAEENYHSTDAVCPHQYIGFYKWLKYVFKADLIIHVGTHGTVEWLPGKEKGLSKKCYPDICMNDFAHLYIYHIGITGEGIQAKRRSKAALLSHSIPSMRESKSYGEIEIIDNLVEEYFHSKRTNTRKIPILKEEIIKEAIEANFDKDLKMTKDEMIDNFELFLDKLHKWFGNIKNSLINDGLHIFGTVLEGERYRNQLRSLVRIRNNDIPPLNMGIAEILKYDYDIILDNPNHVFYNNKTSVMALDEIVEYSELLINKLDDVNYNSIKIKSIINEIFKTNEKDENLSITLKYICDDLTVRVNHITDEIKYAVKGLNGEFIDPSPSGNPTRGRADLLPTGKNFYSIDPTTVPSRAAWLTGKKMGEDLLERFISDEGKYPESIAIIIYSGETMKTKGDDIAEILYLMGVKPVWLATTDKIKGLEVISLEELKRPRIDVLARISGLFRDTFPNIIEMIENAVTLVSKLDEADNMNFIKKHIFEDVKELLINGVDREIAFDEASIRVFGCPPGTYGAGTNISIESKKWNTSSDIGEMYINWSSHGYTSKVHGKKREDLFKNQLRKVEATVKNESSEEIDMLDSDDFYVYHGGLIAAVTSVRGEQPKSYVGNSSDPERVSLLDLNEETARIIRSRVLNPKWFDGLKKHGYKGAQEVSALVDTIFGWDATSNNIEDWMYDKVTEEFILNKDNRNWIQKNNKFAIHSIVEKLLEAIQRKMWNAKEEVKEELMMIYLNSEGILEGGSSE